MSSFTSEQCEALAKSLDIQEYDLLLVGDGSGTVAKKPCGWCVTVYDKFNPNKTVWNHFGGTAAGTNNYAELEPYISALGRHLVENGFPYRPLKVAIVSDSEVTVRCGNGTYGRKANLHLWASIDWFNANRYLTTWHHVPRNSNPLSKHADGVSRTVREAMEKIGQAELLPG